MDAIAWILGNEYGSRGSFAVNHHSPLLSQLSRSSRLCKNLSLSNSFSQTVLTFVLNIMFLVGILTYSHQLIAMAL